MSDRVLFVLGQIVYSDTKDHFENGLLRLMGFDQKTFEKWINASNQYTGSIFEKLKYGFQQLYPEQNTIFSSDNLIIGPGPNNEPGQLWHQILPSSATYSIIKSKDNSIAWLAYYHSSCLLREINPPIYEEEYFEGDTKGVGYGNYITQSWRLDKAKRQLNDIVKRTKLNACKALDIGSGYGYFRKALDDAGFDHDGIEISEHAAKITSSLYGYKTLIGTLEDHKSNLQSKYNLITLWDVIEHIPNPKVFLQNVAPCLMPGGFIALKTPNIDCPEAEIFGPYYHSLKREHLVYFTWQSLERIAKEAGLSLHYKISVSHLLSGFDGMNIQALEAADRVADIVMYFQKN